jgi:hypothetical protein
MKKLSFAIAILISTTCYSQKWGAKYGVILTKINNELYSGPQQSWILGGFYNHKLSDNISIQPELLLSDRGGYYQEASRSVSQKYVDFPIQAKFSLPKRDLKPYLMAGVSPSILLSNKESNDGFVYASKVNAAGIVSIGMDCKVTEKVDMILELRGWAGLDYQSLSFNFGFKF